MKKPDLIITWAKHCDYPIYRKFLRTYRDFFGKVIIYFSNHFREMDYEQFVRKDLGSLPGQNIFIPHHEYQYGVEDWRNVSTNHMLQFSDSEWVCSIEQDFFCRSWDVLLTAIAHWSNQYHFMGYKGVSSGKDYVHPSFWFIKRLLLDQTRKDFSAKDGADHFGLITNDATFLHVPIWYLQDNGFPETDAFHLGGVNGNYLNVQQDYFVLHRPEQFYVYNWWSMKTDVPKNPQFTALCKKANQHFKKEFPDIKPETSEWKEFYDLSGGSYYVAPTY